MRQKRLPENYDLMHARYPQPAWNLRDATVMLVIAGLHVIAIWWLTHGKPPPAPPQEVVLQVSMVKPPDEPTPPEPPKIQRVQPKTSQKVTQQVMQDLPPVITDIPIADPIPEPPPPPSTPAPVPTSKSSTAGNYLIIKQQFKPIYPRRALRDGIQGTVTLLIHVDENGVPTKVEVVKSSGNFDLDNAARNAAMKSTFVPQMQNGVAVKAQGLQDIVFKLDEG